MSVIDGIRNDRRSGSAPQPLAQYTRFHNLSFCASDMFEAGIDGQHRR
jgi:hypothetical protein